MKKLFRIIIAGVFILLSQPIAKAQSNTVGLIMNDSTHSYNGYTLFSPLNSTNTYLIDNEGYLVHYWTSSYRPGQSVMLLPDGSLLRTANVQNGNPFTAGGAGGRIEKYDWDGNLTWSFDCYSSDYCTHHDAEYLPNGDILMIAWEKKTYDEVVAAGKNPADLGSDIWSEKIIEVKPTGSSGGEIVWEWHVWDHLIQNYDSTKSDYGNPAEHPELINLNFGRPQEDWLHINSIRYNPVRDQILISVHNFSEVWIIDHSTTTAQAATHTGGKSGKGGDILYRWGNPQAYGAGTTADEKLFGQHDARWIDSGLTGAGDIMIFNNGQGRSDGSYSTVDEITPPTDSKGNYYTESSGMYGPDNLTWQYKADPASSFYSANIGGADRLANGNTLICEGTSGKFFEVDSAGNTVWEYINPVTRNGIATQGETASGNPVFKIYKYPAQYPGLAGKDLLRQGTIELYPTGIEEDNSVPKGFSLEQNYPNPFNPGTSITYHLGQAGYVSLKVYDILGNLIQTLEEGYESAGSHTVKFDNGSLSSGIYICRLKAGNYSGTIKMSSEK